MKLSRPLAAMLLVSALSACGDNEPAEGEATGEVLEGTISDEMLPLDRVRSEAPLADPTRTGRGSEPGAEAGDPAEANDGAEAEGESAEESPAEPAGTDE